MALSFNRLTQETGIGTGTTINSGNDILVNAKSNTTANSYLLGISVGGIAVGLNAAVSDVSAKINTHIGGEGAESSITAARNIDVYNDTSSSATPLVLAVAAGGVAVGGNVLLAFNNTKANATVDSATVKAVNMSVAADIAGSAKSDLTNVAIGGIAVGVSVNYADMRADNRASVYDSEIDLSGNLSIRTGTTEKSKTIAEAHTISGNVGGITVGLNTAIARNNTKNYAILSGGRKVNVGKNLTVHGTGTSSAIADMTGYDIGDISVAISAVVALNDADARSDVQLSETAREALTVTVGGKAAFNATQNAVTTAKLKTGGGSLIGAKVSAAVAYGRASAQANAEVHAFDAKFGSLDSKINASDTTTATIENESFDFIGAAGRFAGAYSQDVFQSKIVMSSVTTDIKGDVNVNTDYTINSSATVTPSKRGVKVSLADVAINASIAKNTAGASAYFEAVKGTAKVHGDMNIKAIGSDQTDAEVKTAKMTMSGASLGANIAKSDLSARQAAYLRVGNTLNVDGKVDVQSIANNAIANAYIGASGSAMSLDLAHLDVSQAKARENMQSTAALLGGPAGEDTEYYWKDEGKYVTKHRGYYDPELTFSGFHVIRDENGVAEQEMVVMVYYSTGEYEMLNALGQVAISTLDEKNAQGRVEVYRTDPMPGDKMRYDEEYYEWVEEDYEAWEENNVRYGRQIDVYNPEDNIMTAAALNIASQAAEGTVTGATARTDGALNLSLATAGSLDARAISTDSFSVAFEGMTATITGAATLKAATTTVAKAVGMTPGSASLVDVTFSDVTAQVGQRDDKQSVGILIGKGNKLFADSIDITANNYGSATAYLDQGTKLALGKVSKTTQPTESWYNTVISVGRGATLEATGGDLKITSSDVPTAESKVKAATVGLALNFNQMMGKNNIDQENNLDIGQEATITAAKNITLTVDQHTIATAETEMAGGGILEGSTAKAQNTINRVARINIGESAAVTATAGTMTIQTLSGVNDNIYTNAYTESVGAISLANAKAYTDLATYAEINVGQNVTLKSNSKMTLDARATSYNGFTKDKDGKVIGAGVRTQAVVDAGGLVPLPQTVARNTMYFRSYINLNKRDEKTPNVAGKQTTLESETSDILVNASNEGLVLYARTKSVGKGLAGTSNANAWNEATLTNAIWIDDTKLTGHNVLIYADNGSMLKNGLGDKAADMSDMTKYMQDANNKYKPHFISDSFAELKGVGKVAPDSRITGTMINQIRSHSVPSVKFEIKGGKEEHLTSDPYNAIWQEAKVKAEYKKILGIPLAKADKTVVTEWYSFDRCDFCGKGTKYDVQGTAQESLEKRYEDIFKKILSPINDIQEMISSLGGITKARYGEEDYTTASKKFVLEVQSMLECDVKLSPDKVKEYRLWMNTRTFMDVYLMPNATRLYTSGRRLQYAVDVISGDLFGEGRNLDIEILTALSASAFAKGEVPVGSTGSLDLTTGMLTLPDSVDYELYLHEISADWLLNNMKDGFIRTLVADPEAVTACALEGGSLPSGAIEQMLTEGEPLNIEGLEGWELYWIGATPETATDPDQPLIGLLVNPETDEIDAFRTSLNMIENGEDIIDVSLYMYRDSKSDRMGEEKYNVMFFDTPAGERSLVKAVTDVLQGRDLVTPTSLKIKLRGRYLEGADMPVYVLTDHAFIMCDGTDGIVDILGGYQATFDGDVFESNYTRIEGIRDGNLSVTVKEGQPIWPEWSGKDSAEDIGGKKFQLLEEGWEEIPEDAVMQADKDEDDAA